MVPLRTHNPLWINTSAGGPHIPHITTAPDKDYIWIVQDITTDEWMSLINEFAVMARPHKNCTDEITYKTGLYFYPIHWWVDSSSEFQPKNDFLPK